MEIIYLIEGRQTAMRSWQGRHIIGELKLRSMLRSVIDVEDFEWLTKLKDCVNKSKFEGRENKLVLLTFLSDAYILQPALQLMSQKGVPSVLLCFDNLHAPYKHKHVANLFDLVWLTSCETEGMFKKWGAKKVIFQPYAASPKIMQTLRSKKPQSTVGFVGSIYGSRVNQLAFLSEGRVPTRILTSRRSDLVPSSGKNGYFKLESWREAIQLLQFNVGRKLLWGKVANRWRQKEDFSRLNPKIEYREIGFEEMYSLFRNWSLTLNITELRNTGVLQKPVYKLHLRTFEIPMAGGLQLAAYTKEIAEYFKEDEEVLLYRDWQEMLDKAKFWLNPKRETQVEKMKKAARERALKEHTWMHRFSKVEKALHSG